MFTVTVEIAAPDSKAARLALESAGFTVSRVAAPKAAAAPTSIRQAGVRASSLTDRPAGLDRLEGKAYARGYAKACLAYVRKHGIPRVDETHTTLHAVTVHHEWERHAAAHKAGMRELAKEQAHPSRITAHVQAA